MRIKVLHAMGDRGTEALAGVNLDVRAGEIVGLAGVSGNGQRELAQCLAGLRKVTARHSFDLWAGPDRRFSSAHRRRPGIRPEERMRDGAIRDFSVEENLFLRDTPRPKFTRGIFLNFPKWARMPASS